MNLKKHVNHVTNPDNYGEARNAAHLPAAALRDTSAPCASGDKCMLAPPARVEIRGEQCRACLRVQREMTARLRARR